MKKNYSFNKLSFRLIVFLFFIFVSIPNSLGICATELTSTLSSLPLFSINDDKDATIDNLKNKLDIANKKIYDLECELNEVLKKQNYHSPGVTYNINPSDKKDAIIDYLRMKYSQANAKIRDLENQLSYALKNARNNNTNVPSQNHSGSSDNQKDYLEIHDTRTTETTKIEPYQSNSKNKMSYNGIIVGEDNEIYEGGFVPVIIEFEKEMQSNTETGNIIVKINDRGTSKLYYAEFNKDSELTVTNDYLVIVKCAWSCYSFVVKSDEDWSFVIETTKQSVMNGKILKKYIIAIEDATKEDFRSIISFFKH